MTLCFISFLLMIFSFLRNGYFESGIRELGASCLLGCGEFNVTCPHVTPRCNNEPSCEDICAARCSISSSIWRSEKQKYPGCNSKMKLAAEDESEELKFFPPPPRPPDFLFDLTTTKSPSSPSSPSLTSSTVTPLTQTNTIDTTQAVQPEQTTTTTSSSSITPGTATPVTETNTFDTTQPGQTTTATSSSTITSSMVTPVTQTIKESTANDVSPQVSTATSKPYQETTSSIKQTTSTEHRNCFLVTMFCQRFWVYYEYKVRSETHCLRCPLYSSTEHCKCGWWRLFRRGWDVVNLSQGRGWDVVSLFELTRRNPQGKKIVFPDLLFREFDNIRKFQRNSREQHHTQDSPKHQRPTEQIPRKQQEPRTQEDKQEPTRQQTLEHQDPPEQNPGKQQEPGAEKRIGIPQEKVSRKDQLKQKLNCRPRRIWAYTPAMTKWCNENCNFNPPNCPRTHCICDYK